MAVNPNIKKKADDIRNKIYGKEVRESLASGLEEMSSDVVENEGRQSVVEGRQDSVESQFQDVIDNTTGKDVISAPEIIAARNGEANLKARIDKDHQEVTAQLAQTEKDNFNSNQFLEMPDNYLEIPSAIGNSLTTHPSIIDFQIEFGVEQWNGYRYWMAHTPYPGTQNENPSIAASNDNVNWILPDGAPNPLVEAPTAPAYNSDTEMIYLEEVNTLRMYYREVGLDNKVRIYYIESSDGSNWSTPELSIETENNALSPSIIRENSTTWKMWTVESTGGFHYRTSTDGKNWSTHQYIAQPWENWSAWHFEVNKDGNGKYHMLASTWLDAGSGEGTQYRPIVYASSDDGFNWTPNEKPQLIPTGWAGGYLYRPSFIIDESKGLKDEMVYVRVWFSAAEDSTAAGWHIGFTEGYLMVGDSNASATSEKIKRKKIGEYFKVFASNIVAPFAKIARLKTKRIEVTSDFSQPLIEWRDGRPQRDGSNYMREHYHGHEDNSLIRHFLTFTDDNGNQRQITLQPFNDTVSFSEPTTINNIKEAKITEVINYGGFRSYRAGTTTDYNRITTDSAGVMRMQLSARGQNYEWQLKAASGTMDAGGNALENIKYLTINTAVSIASAPNGALFEDADGKLKYKNQAGVVTVLT